MEIQKPAAHKYFRAMQERGLIKLCKNKKCMEIHFNDNIIKEAIKIPTRILRL